VWVRQKKREGESSLGKYFIYGGRLRKLLKTLQNEEEHFKLLLTHSHTASFPMEYSIQRRMSSPYSIVEPYPVAIFLLVYI
jgi:hypothetical protein